MLPYEIFPSMSLSYIQICVAQQIYLGQYSEEILMVVRGVNCWPKATYTIAMFSGGSLWSEFSW
jgi:hypothetical protein